MRARARSAAEGLRRGPDRARRCVFALACMWVLGGAVLARPNTYGDGGEYQLMAESLRRHASPEVRPDDVRALAARAPQFRNGIDVASTLRAYHQGHDGRWYCYHFWGYSLLTVPLRAVLRTLRGDELRSAQITNALVLLLALHQALWRAALPRRAALGLALLALFSPAVWFVGWTHPEALCFALALLALVWARSGRRHAAVASAAVATAQNPPLAWLLVPLWARACLRPGGFRPGLRASTLASLAALPALLHPLFFLWRFGTPSVVAREAMDFDLLSPRRALDLLFDLNLGLLPYAPATVALFFLALGLALASRDARRAAAAGGHALVLFLVALSCTVNPNWNHGSAGPSRYAVWIAPLVLAVVAAGYASALERGGARARAWGLLVAVAVAGEAAIVAARGGLVQAPDHQSHSWAARLVLRHAPALYSPAPDIFVARTGGAPGRGWRQPAIYRDEQGCRKAWVRPRDAGLVMQTCGRLPPGEEAFFARATRRRQWRYVDF